VAKRAEVKAPVSTRFRYLTRVTRADKDSGKKKIKRSRPGRVPHGLATMNGRVNLMGHYLFHQPNSLPNSFMVERVQSTSEGNPVLRQLRTQILEASHAWAGGGDLQYFFIATLAWALKICVDASKSGFISSKITRSRFLFRPE